ncbi:MAG: hypothetical protein A2Z14_16305 [Chloroflexi bacterium RBG_16_48_8]|nr:MAG: hypothetical protein A2Z14_16305 [Chloroflexi bacterium RBG_16_48_8]
MSFRGAQRRGISLFQLHSAYNGKTRSLRFGRDDIKGRGSTAVDFVKRLTILIAGEVASERISWKHLKVVEENMNRSVYVRRMNWV